MSAAKNIHHAASLYGQRVRDGNTPAPEGKDIAYLKAAREYIDFLLTGEGDPSAKAGAVFFEHDEAA